MVSGTSHSSLYNELLDAQTENIGRTIGYSYDFCKNAIYQILVDGLEAFFAIVIICIDHNERGIDYFLRCKHGLSSSPRLCAEEYPV